MSIDDNDGGAPPAVLVRGPVRRCRTDGGLASAQPHGAQPDAGGSARPCRQRFVSAERLLPLYSARYDVHIVSVPLQFARALGLAVQIIRSSQSSTRVFVIPEGMQARRCCSRSTSLGAASAPSTGNMSRCRHGCRSSSPAALPLPISGRQSSGCSPMADTAPSVGKR